jgi:hypothetical protein
MEALNTKLFTFEELKYKSYSKLYKFIDSLNGLILDLEIDISDIEEVEIETGELTKELSDALNCLITQLDYVNKNLNTALKALEYNERLVFMTFINHPTICLN